MMRYHIMLIKMATTKTAETSTVGKDVEKLESLCAVGGT